MGSLLDQDEFLTQIRALKEIKDSLFEQNRKVEKEKEKIEEEKGDLRQILDSTCSDRLCCSCMDQLSAVVFFPCCHLACCQTCSVKVHSCPICRKHIQNRVPVFIP